MLRHAACATQGDRLAFRLHVPTLDAGDRLESEDVPERDSSLTREPTGW